MIYFKLPTPRFRSLKFKDGFPVYLLIVPVALSVFLVFYPYIPSMNPTGEPVGVDILEKRMYASCLEEMLSVSFQEALGQMFTVFSGSMPLTFLVMYIVAVTTKLPALTVAKMFPLILAPSYVLSIYFTTKLLLGDSFTAWLASFIAATSQFFTVAMFSGYLANWLAFILILPSIALLIKGLEEKSYRRVLYSLILSVVALFTHPYVWTIYIVAIAVYTALKRKHLKMLILWVAVNLATDLTKTYILNTIGGIRGELVTASYNLSIENLMAFWNINIHLFRYFHAGYQTIPVLYILAIVGLLSMQGIQGDIFKILVATCIPFYFTGSEIVQSRILFNLPLDILAAIGLTTILATTHGKHKHLSITILVLLIFINYALRALAGMVII